MKTRNIILISILISIIISTLAILAGAINWIWQFIICGILFFSGGFLLKNNKIKTWISLAILLTPFLSIYGFIVIKDWQVHVFPIVITVIINSFLGVFLKSLYLKAKKKNIILIYAGAYIVILSIFGYIFMPNWLSYIFIEKTIVRESPDFIIKDIRAGEEFSLKEIKEDIIVMDFWNTTCGVCFEKFPNFQELKEHYKNEDIAFLAVNMPLKRDYEENRMERSLKVFDNNKYNFNVVIMDSIFSNSFEIYGVPTIIIIDRNRNIIYKGDLITDRKVIINNAYNIIDELLDKK